MFGRFFVECERLLWATSTSTNVVVDCIIWVC